MATGSDRQRAGETDASAVIAPSNNNLVKPVRYFGEWVVARIASPTRADPYINTLNNNPQPEGPIMSRQDSERIMCGYGYLRRYPELLYQDAERGISIQRAITRPDGTIAPSLRRVRAESDPGVHQRLRQAAIAELPEIWGEFENIPLSVFDKYDLKIKSIRQMFENEQRVTRRFTGCYDTAEQNEKFQRFFHHFGLGRLENYTPPAGDATASEGWVEPGHENMSAFNYGTHLDNYLFVGSANGRAAKSGHAPEIYGCDPDRLNFGPPGMCIGVHLQCNDYPYTAGEIGELVTGYLPYVDKKKHSYIEANLPKMMRTMVGEDATVYAWQATKLVAELTNRPVPHSNVRWQRTLPAHVHTTIGHLRVLSGREAFTAEESSKMLVSYVDQEVRKAGYPGLPRDIDTMEKLLNFRKYEKSGRQYIGGGLGSPTAGGKKRQGEPDARPSNSVNARAGARQNINTPTIPVMPITGIVLTATIGLANIAKGFQELPQQGGAAPGSTAATNAGQPMVPPGVHPVPARHHKRIGELEPKF
ncbi:hypothetical protein [Yinghuangia aomiensis]|uniref:hypothetical protein n=1 Tax=Yinghuangia aomiensis TaxID=676205 RepID=UPI0031EEAACA